MMLSARNLTVMRDHRIVLRDATFALAPGTLTAICGPNGAGKSTLLAALAGLLPSPGTVTLGQRSLGSITTRERARSIGFLPQQAETAWDISVETLVALGRLPWRAVSGRPARANREDDARAVAEAIETMELAELRGRPVSQLSGGEKARAMMARVLAGEPQWILADEPFASLDLAHQERLAIALRQQAKAGRGVVVVMHDLAAAMNHADRAIVLDDGRFVADAPPEVALSEDVLKAVWKVQCRWLGQAGSRALALGH